MCKRIGFAMVMIVITFSFCLSFAGPNMKPGKWEITTEMEMPGMPMKMPPSVSTQCITEKDLVPENKQPGQECQVTDVKTSGDTVTWTMICKNEGGTTKGKGKITYHGDEMSGTFEMEMEDTGTAMKIINKIRGRRIGDCN